MGCRALPAAAALVLGGGGGSTCLRAGLLGFDIYRLLVCWLTVAAAACCFYACCSMQVSYPMLLMSVSCTYESVALSTRSWACLPMGCGRMPKGCSATLDSSHSTA